MKAKDIQMPDLTYFRGLVATDEDLHDFMSNTMLADYDMILDIAYHNIKEFFEPTEPDEDDDENKINDYIDGLIFKIDEKSYLSKSLKHDDVDIVDFISFENNDNDRFANRLWYFDEYDNKWNLIAPDNKHSDKQINFEPNYETYREQLFNKFCE